MGILTMIFGDDKQVQEIPYRSMYPTQEEREERRKEVEKEALEKATATLEQYQESYSSQVAEFSFSVRRTNDLLRISVSGEETTISVPYIKKVTLRRGAIPSATGGYVYYTKGSWCFTDEWHPDYFSVYTISGHLHGDYPRSAQSAVVDFDGVNFSIAIPKALEDEFYTEVLNHLHPA